MQYISTAVLQRTLSWRGSLTASPSELEATQLGRVVGVELTYVCYNMVSVIQLFNCKAFFFVSFWIFKLVRGNIKI